MIKIILALTWWNDLGIRLRPRLKKTNFILKRLGWVTLIYRSNQHPILKKWFSLAKIGWYNFPLKNNCNIIGVADPFLIKHQSSIYIYFELINSNKGEIWCGQLIGGKIKNINPVIKEDFHLSFPNVFIENGRHYLIPESGEDLSIRLYEADKFPYSWSLKKVINKGGYFVDTSFVKIDNIYFWFVYDFHLQDSLIFYSYSIEGKWNLHPEVKNIKYRNGGQLFKYKGLLLRPVQNVSGSYGSGLSIMKITKITINEYKEEIFYSDFLRKGRGNLLEGAHHLSFLKLKKSWIIAIDGINRNFFNV